MAPAGFPPIPYYFIDDRLGPSATVLAGDPHPLFYANVQRTCYHYYNLPRDEYRLDYLRAMTHFENAKPRGYIVFTGVEQYRREAEAYRATVEAFWYQLRGRLVSSKLLPDNDPAKPAIEIAVKDQRRERAPALPIVDGFVRTTGR